MTRLRYDLDYLSAVKFLDFVERAQEGNVLNIVFVDESIYHEADEIFRRYDAVKLSFTDCTSFAVCQMHRIKRVFAFDQHLKP